MQYPITVVESEEGFAVWCDDLPGCCSQGETRAEALENIRIAIKEWLSAQLEIEKTLGVKIEHELVTV
ncbi:MAG: type II toxin-antitoxin system HicB family antitoxin [Verrucomicrobiota bacterium]|nr:type II toxin-antitoxin system HicB family antitoxin [Verrucomicrobiota bacterium]